MLDDPFCHRVFVRFQIRMSITSFDHEGMLKTATYCTQAIHMLFCFPPGECGDQHMLLQDFILRKVHLAHPAFLWGHILIDTRPHSRNETSMVSRRGLVTLNIGIETSSWPFQIIHVLDRQIGGRFDNLPAPSWLTDQQRRVRPLSARSCLNIWVC
jgi:hypothetical protein